MVIGVRRKHWVLASLSLTAFLLLLVYSTSPLHSHTPPPVAGEIGFLRRRIANDNSIGATGFESAPLDPHNLAPTPRSIPPGPSGIHLTEKQKQELAKQGVLLLDETENQPGDTNNADQQHQQTQEQQQPQVQTPLQKQQLQQQTQQQQIQQPPQQQQKQLQLSNQQTHQPVQRKTQSKQPQVERVVQEPQKDAKTNPQGGSELEVEIPEVSGVDGGSKSSKTKPAGGSQLEAEVPEVGGVGTAPKTSKTKPRGGSEIEVEVPETGGHMSPHAQWLRELEQQHKDFVRHRLHDPKYRGRHKGQHAVVSGGQAGGFPVWRTGRVSYEGLRKQMLEMVQRTVQHEFAGIEQDMAFTPGQVVPEGQGRKVLILSTWRSGSTYLGDLLKAYPGTYYSFEPLHFILKNHHLEEGPLTETAQQVLHKLLSCDYKGLEDYLTYARNSTFLLSHNTRVWNICTKNKALCFDKEFLSRACQLMPVKVAKTVRMGLSPVVPLLQDSELDLRVLHLIRDPRGCLHSRLKLAWCHSDVCRNPATVCQNLLTDLTLSDWVKENFPNRYLMVRYEDLGLNPEEAAREIYNFLQLSFNKHVTHFVKEHTKSSHRSKKNKDVYGTYRDSKATIFAWRGALDYETVREIQTACTEPMQRLNLRLFESEEEYLNMTIPVLLDV